MSRSQFQSKVFILRHAWLNLWDERMTTGRINQVAILWWFANDAITVKLYSWKHNDTTTTVAQVPRGRVIFFNSLSLKEDQTNGGSQSFCSSVASVTYPGTSNPHTLAPRRLTRVCRQCSNAYCVECSLGARRQKGMHPLRSTCELILLLRIA